MSTIPKILLPPGIGDVYWSLVKMESFLEQNGLGRPDVYIASQADIHGSETRAFPFIEHFSFVNSTGVVVDNSVLGESTFWTHAYTQPHTGIFADVIGYDYFMAYNGPINAGLSLEVADEEYACNWDLRIPDSQRQNDIVHSLTAQYAPYIVYHFGTRGTYKYWTDEFQVGKIAESIKRASKRTGTTPILAGGVWDRQDKGLLKIMRKAKCVDMLGKTSFEGLCGLIRGSEMVVGYPSGLEMLATILGKKTLTLWSEYYPFGTSQHVVAPNKVGSVYFTEKTKGLTVKKLVNKIGAING